MTNEATVSTPQRPPVDGESLGERLRRIREEAGLSQRALAFAGCSPAYISRIEAGERAPSQAVVRQLAARLHVSHEYLASGQEAAEPEPPALLEAEMALRLDEPERAAALFEEIAEGEAGAPLRARALSGLGQLAFREGHVREAADKLEEALELAPEAETPALAETLGRAYATLGDRASAVVIFERHLKAANERKDVLESIRFGVLLANALIDSSQFNRATALLAQVLGQSEVARDPLLRARLYWSQSRLHALQNDSELAARYALRALETLELTEDTHYLARAHHMLAFIELDRGNPGEALDLLRRGRDLFGGAADRVEIAAFELEEARALAQLGEREEAASRAMRLAAVLRDADPIEVGRSYALLAETFDDAGDAARARELYELAMEFLEPTPTKYLIEVCARFGDLLERGGDRDAAFAVYKRGIQLQQQAHANLTSS